MIHVVFFVSGFAAVIYQIIWQRVLLTMYGANIESVTIVVTAFMGGLGIGSLLGGRLATRAGLDLPVVFAAMELGIGGCGVASLALLHAVGAWTADASPVIAGLAIFGLLLVPTVLMGATLPILVADAVREARTVGRAVGGLYATNAMGSAAGALSAVLVMFGPLGQRKSVWLAAGLNVAVTAVVLTWRRMAVRPA